MKLSLVRAPSASRCGFSHHYVRCPRHTRNFIPEWLFKKLKFFGHAIIIKTPAICDKHVDWFDDFVEDF